MGNVLADQPPRLAQEDLADAQDKTRRLVRFVLVVTAGIGLFAIWSEAMPTLQILRRVGLALDSADGEHGPGRRSVEHPPGFRSGIIGGSRGCRARRNDLSPSCSCDSGFPRFSGQWEPTLFGLDSLESSRSSGSRYLDPGRCQERSWGRGTHSAEENHLGQGGADRLRFTGALCSCDRRNHRYLRVPGNQLVQRPVAGRRL